MSGIEQRSDLMRDNISDANLNTSAVGCCLDLLNPQGPESPGEERKVDEQYSDSFLPDFQHLLPEALLQDQARSQALLEEQNMGWQVMRGLADLSFSKFSYVHSQFPCSLTCCIIDVHYCPPILLDTHTESSLLQTSDK